jgi:hypothetical protein
MLPRMLKRTSKITLEILGALVGLAAIVAGVLTWRVAQGPVELDVLTPYLEDALAAGVGNFDVSVGGTLLAWEGWPETFALRVRDVRVTRAGSQVARVPAVDVRLSLAALASGTVAPTVATGRGADLTVVRGSDGFRFGAAPSTAGAADPAVDPEGRAETDISGLVPALLDDLMAAPSPEVPLSYLNRLEIVDSRVIVHDEILGVTWVAPEAAVRLGRSDDGLDGQADLSVALGGGRVEAAARIGYVRGSGRLDLDGSFDGLEASALAAKVPELGPAAGVTLPLSGEAEATLALSGELRTAAARVRGGAGQLSWPGLLPDPRPVERLDVRATYDAVRRQASVERLEIAFGDAEVDGPTIQASGSAATTPDGTGVGNLKARVTGLPIERLDAYWPVGMAKNARDWVVPNIRAGRAETAELTAGLRLPAGQGLGAIELAELDGTIRYSDLDVHYLRPMPPVEDVHGTATFTADDFVLEVAGGRLGDLRVPRADIAIDGMLADDQVIDIDFGLTGPLRQALTVLDHPRLDLMARLGLEPEKAAGRIVESAVRFQFPLIDDLTFDETEVQAEATLREVSVADFALGQNASDGRFDLTVDQDGMRVDGPVRLGGVEVSEMVWQERFAAGAEVVTRIDARVPALDAASRARLGVETRPFVDGPVGLDITLKSFRGAKSEVALAADLTPARIDLPQAQWTKPPGNAGKARAAVRLRDGAPVAVTGVSAQADGADGADLRVEQGSGDLEAGGQGVGRLELGRLALARTDVTKLSLERTASGWRAGIGGGVLDLAPFLGGDLLESDAAQAAPPGPPIELRESNLSRVYVAPGSYIDDVTLSARRGPDGWWRVLRIAGRAPARFDRAGDTPGESARPFRLSYAPGPDGRQRIEVNAADSGAMLRALDIYDGIEGGTMRVTGTGRTTDPRSPLDAQVRITDFRLVDAPALAKILTLASFTGIRNVLQGEGIAFESLTGEVVFDRGALSTDLLHAYGPALGVTVQGNIDLDADRADLNGVVVPAASTNRVLGNIPVLGRLLTGGEGEGLFAVNYTVTGPLGEPQVDVNPLSALAPGFLRGLFGRLGELGEGDSQTSDDWPPTGQDR